MAVYRSNPDAGPEIDAPGIDLATSVADVEGIEKEVNFDFESDHTYDY